MEENLLLIDCEVLRAQGRGFQSRGPVDNQLYENNHGPICEVQIINDGLRKFFPCLLLTCCTPQMRVWPAAGSCPRSLLSKMGLASGTEGKGR